MCAIWRSAQRCSVKKVFCNKVEAWACNFIKKRLWHRCFPVNFAKFRRTPFLTEHLRWLLLTLAINRISTNHTRTFITRHVHHFNVINTNIRKVITNCIIMLHFKHNLNKKYLNFLAEVALVNKLSF